MRKTVETSHELSPEHAGFRAEHEDFKAGLLGLAVTVGLTTGLMALFAKKNNEEHRKLQAQLDDLYAGLGVDELIELPAYSRSRPTLPGAARKVYGS